MANKGFQKDDEQNRFHSLAFIIAIVVATLLSAFFASSGFSRTQQRCEMTLEGRINPNAAPDISLARLPGVGLTRAKAIVDYRSSFSGQQDDKQAFSDCNDLDKVKGIGPKTVQNISQWLKFK
jgi:DNA uptake protein ComE-like DNA-binding protein